MAKKKGTRPNTDELVEFYLSSGSIQSCVKHFGISKHTVREVLTEAGINSKNKFDVRKDRGMGVLSRVEPPPLEEVTEEYLKAGGNVSALARKYNVSDYYVKLWLQRAGVEFKSAEQISKELGALSRTPIPPREELEEMYSQMSMYELGKHYHVGSCVRDWLEDYGIERPSHGDRVSQMRKANYADVIDTLPNPAETYKENGYNKTKTTKDLGLTRNQMDALFEKYDIETRDFQCSEAELQLRAYVQELDPEGNWHHDRGELLGNHHVDILSHERKLGIEYGGLKWHCEASTGRGRPYHYQKMKRCRDLGYELITVFDSDDIDKVRRLIRLKLGKMVRVYARQCEVREIDSSMAMSFESHLQASSCQSSVGLIS